MLKKSLIIAWFVLFTVCMAVEAVWAAVAVVEYAYDETGHLQSVQYAGGQADIYHYDAMGNRLSRTVTSDAANSPPLQPASPFPAENETGVDPAITLEWTAGDPDAGGSLSYSVYLGTSTDPPLYKSGLTCPMLSTGGLVPNTTYYWKVVARDNYNATHEGALWSFTTGNRNPGTPSSPLPGSGFEVNSQNVYLAWSAVDPDKADILVYDIYFGTTESPSLLKAGHDSPSYDIGELIPGQTYYWKILARDMAGSTAEGPVWSFTTSSGGPTRYTTSLSITEDTILTKANGPYVFEGSLIIEKGATLTIEPGSVLKFAKGSDFIVSGILLAQGTAEEKIVFTSYRDDRYGGDTNGDWSGGLPEPGDWGSVYFHGNSAGSRLSHAMVLFTGRGNGSAIRIAALDVAITDTSVLDAAGDGIYSNQNGQITISRNLIARCQGYGIHVFKGAPVISENIFETNGNYDLYLGSAKGLVQDNTITNGIYAKAPQTSLVITGNKIIYNNHYPLVLPGAEAGQVIGKNLISGTNNKSIIELQGGVISRDGVWPADFIYKINGPLYIHGEDGDDGVTTLTIAPGSRLRFKSSSFLRVGNNHPGALHAAGTLEKPITFMYITDPAGTSRWDGIQFNSGTVSDRTYLSHCIIENAGTSRSPRAIYIAGCSPTITHTHIRGSDWDGIYVATGSPKFINGTIMDCARHSIYVSFGSPEIKGNTFERTGGYDIYLHSGAGTVLENNTLKNGIYSYDSSLGPASGNRLAYNDVKPLRLKADDVGPFMSNNLVSGITPESVLEVLDGTISRDASWPAAPVYKILGRILVKGVDGGDGVTTLTIAPGADLRFNRGSSLMVGASYGDPGALRAVGTAEDPVVMTSGESPQAPGDWGGITFYLTSGAFSRLEHCLIEYAGAGLSGRAVSITGASPTIKDSLIRYSPGYGIYMSGGASVIQGNTFDENGNYDIYLTACTGARVTDNTISSGIYTRNSRFVSASGNTLVFDDDRPLRLGADAVGAFLGANSFSGVTTSSVIEVEAGTISRDAFWPGEFIYKINGALNINGEDGDDGVTTLTIAPGSRLLFGTSSYLRVGSSIPGALHAAGTPEKPICFKYITEPAGSSRWSGLQFYWGTASGQSILSHCTIENAGNSSSSRAILISNCSPTITHTHISGSKGDGIHTSNGSPVIRDGRITNCGRHGIYIASGSSEIKGNTFEGTGGYDIYQNSGTGTVLENNRFQNSIYANTLFGSASGNSLAYNNVKPLHLKADDVGPFMVNNLVSGITSESLLEVQGGTIFRDASWPAAPAYQIFGNLLVQGAHGEDGVTTLTIAPGATLRFNRGYDLKVGGHSGNPGALAAVGTVDKPVVMTSSQSSPAAGDWKGVCFYPTSDPSSCLEHCRIEYAGYGASGRAVWGSGASPTIKASLIRYSQGHGIYMAGGAPVIRDNTFEEIGNYDIYLTACTGAALADNTINSGIYASNSQFASASGNTLVFNEAKPLRLGADAVGSFIAANTFTNVTPASVIEVEAGTISHDASWPADFVYEITGALFIDGDDGDDGVTTLTIAPGSRLLFGASAYIRVGYSSPGALYAAGTLEAPITFKYITEPAGTFRWAGLQFYGRTAPDQTLLSHCTIENAGNSSSSRAIFVSNCSPVITHTHISGSKGDGIYVAGGSPRFTDGTITDCGRYGIFIASGDPEIKDNTFEGTGSYDIYLSTGSGTILENNILKSGIYASSGSFGSASGNSLVYNHARPPSLKADDVGPFMENNTISGIIPESVLEVAGGTISHDAAWPDDFIYKVKGVLLIDGEDGEDGVTTLTIAPGSRLLFGTSAYLRVGYSFPGALCAAGTLEKPITFKYVTEPAGTSRWTGLQFYSRTSPVTSLSHCIIENAGDSSNSRAVFISGCSPVITNTHISKSKGDGIYVSNGAPVFTNGSISDCGRYGVNIVAGDPEIKANVFNEIGGYDIYLSNGSGTVLDDNTLKNGIYAKNGRFESVKGNSLTYTDAKPLALNADDVGPFMADNTVSGITPESVLEVQSGTVSRDAFWPAAPGYRILGNILVQGIDGEDGVTTLTIAPGAGLRFNRYTGLTVGANSGDPGELQAVGTADQPIIMTANQPSPTPGHWKGVYFYTTSDPSSRLEHCLVEYGGHGNLGSVYVVKSTPSIISSFVRHSSNYGIYTNSCTPRISQCGFSDNTNYSVYNVSAANTLSARNNWWGHPSGPYHPTLNPDGTGQPVSNYVDFIPWLTASQDRDADGLLDVDEYLAGTDPLDSDSDGDGMADGWEAANGFNLLENDALGDEDADGLSNLTEYLAGLGPADTGEGITLVDFEGESLALFYWITQPPGNWAVGTSHSYSGSCALESIPAEAGATSVIETAVNCTNGQVGFMFSLTARQGENTLYFYIDDTLMGQWSGDQPYRSAVFPVSPGRHDLKWIHNKEGAGDNSGARVDHLVMPGRPDSDEDGILDGWEYTYFNGLDHDMASDSDSDGVSDGAEYDRGTDPLVAQP